MCSPLCSSSVHVRTATWTHGIHGSVSLSLSLFLLFSLSGSLSSRPSSIRVCCALPISLCVCLPLSFALSPRPSPSYSLSLVVSSSRRTPSFAPYCHASVPLPAIRNAAVALLRYLRDVSYAAPSTRVVPPVSTWLLACSLARSLACLLSCQLACVRPGRKSTPNGFTCPMCMNFFRESLSPFKSSVLLARRRRLRRRWTFSCHRPGLIPVSVIHTRITVVYVCRISFGA